MQLNNPEHTTAPAASAPLHDEYVAAPAASASADASQLFNDKNAVPHSSLGLVQGSEFTFDDEDTFGLDYDTDNQNAAARSISSLFPPSVPEHAVPHPSSAVHDSVNGVNMVQDFTFDDEDTFGLDYDIDNQNAAARSISSLFPRSVPRSVPHSVPHIFNWEENDGYHLQQNTPEEERNEPEEEDEEEVFEMEEMPDLRDDDNPAMAAYARERDWRIRQRLYNARNLAMTPISGLEIVSETIEVDGVVKTPSSTESELRIGGATSAPIPIPKTPKTPRQQRGWCRHGMSIPRRSKPIHRNFPAGKTYLEDEFVFYMSMPEEMNNIPVGSLDLNEIDSDDDSSQIDLSGDSSQIDLDDDTVVPDS